MTCLRASTDCCIQTSAEPLLGKRYQGAKQFWLVSMELYLKFTKIWIEKCLCKHRGMPAASLMRKSAGGPPCVYLSSVHKQPQAGSSRRCSFTLQMLQERIYYWCCLIMRIISNLSGTRSALEQLRAQQSCYAGHLTDCIRLKRNVFHLAQEP